jgi:ribonuclease BN (tRNA processing enzyme)
VPDWNINIFGPGQNARDIEEFVSTQMKAPYFPVGTESWLANINYLDPPANGVISYGDIELTYENVHHPGTTYGYRIKVKDKTILYISDNECMYLDKSISSRHEELNEEEKELFNKMKEEEYASEVDLLQGTDILIHDAQYTAEDYQKKRGWGHSCYIDTVNTAIDAGVKELYLYHHDPNYDDVKMEEIHKHASNIVRGRNSDMKCHLAREGVTVDLS